MKRTGLFLSLAILCAAAAIAVPYYQRAHELSVRQAAYAQMLADSKPLVLDAATQAILTGADQVETFRLADFHEGKDRTSEEQDILSGPHTLSLDDYLVLRVGPAEGRTFASALNASVSEMPSPSLMAMVPSCFDPGVAFRVWHGKSHVDMCVCFYCAGVQIITKDVYQKIIQQTTTSLGASRPAFLALSKQAFPQDKHLAALN